MRGLLLAVVLLAPGCATVPKEYIEADEQTLTFAAPKLEAWSKTQDKEWQKLVKLKLESWKARIEKFKQGQK